MCADDVRDQHPDGSAGSETSSAIANSVPDSSLEDAITAYEAGYLKRRVSFMPWLRRGPIDPKQRAIQEVLRRYAGAVFGEGAYVSADAQVFTKRLMLGARSWIAGGAVIRGDVLIGEDSTINPYAQIAGKVSIGSGVRIAANVALFGFNHRSSRTDVPIHKQGLTTLGIVIGDGAWLGANSVVVDGAAVGAHSIVAAGAVVTKKFGDYQVIGGVPARVIRSRRPNDVPPEGLD